MDDATQELGEFFDYVWHDTEGYVYLPRHLPPYGKDDWKAAMFPWPAKRDAVVRYVLRWTAEEANVFYAPSLFRKGTPAKENVLGSWLLYVDFDGNAPADWAEAAGKLEIPEPTMIVQSSFPENQHAYWQLEEFLTDVATLEDRNRVLAYTFGADTSGWDANQILRPPHTINRKNGLPVHLVKWES